LNVAFAVEPRDANADNPEEEYFWVPVMPLRSLLLAPGYQAARGDFKILCFAALA
jgi:hypothetical protein